MLPGAFQFLQERSISCILSHISTLLPRNYEWWCISARKVCLVWKEISPPAKGCGTLRLGVEVFADSRNSSSNLWDVGASRKTHVYCNLQFVRDALRSQKGLFLHSPPPHLFWNLFNLINCVLSFTIYFLLPPPRIDNPTSTSACCINQQSIDCSKNKTHTDQIYL